MNDKSKDERRLAAEIAESEELIRKAIFGVLRHLGEGNPHDDPFFVENKELPKWRSVFSRKSQREKKGVLDKVQELCRKGEFDKVMEVTDCVNFLVNCRDFCRNGFPYSMPAFGVDSEREPYFRLQVKEFVESYVSSFGAQISEEAFYAIFKAFHKHFPEFPETINMEIAILTGIDVQETDRIIVGDFEIREINPVELGIFEGLHDSNLGCYDNISLSKKVWVLEVKNVMQPEIVGGDNDWGIEFPEYYVHPHEIEESILTALRLFRGGDIRVSYKLSYESIKCGAMSIGYGSDPKDHFWPDNLFFTLRREDSTSLSGLWQAFNNISKERKERKRIAITRFNRARENPSSEDQIVDAMISLENLFPSSGHEYIGTNIGKSLNSLIGTKDSGYSVLETTKAAYFARNKIVHGEDVMKTPLLVKGKEVKFKVLLGIIMEWLRKSLLLTLLE